jgi:DNA primase
VYNIKRLRATLNLQSRANDYLEYRDMVDLYSHSVTQKLIREASERLETGTIAMQKTIVALTKALENYREEQRENYAKQKEADANRGQETFTTAELQQGKAFLLEPNLMALTQHHIENIGLVGEEEKGMLLFFILLTRMFKNPLHALVQGKSGSGKTYLLKKIASLLPKAHIRMTTALTENTLYHSTKGFWTNKVLLIEDLDGVLSALLPLREMMSNQSISKMSTEKDMKTGEFGPKQLYVDGPICVAGATTKDSIYEDNANRSFLIQVNETNEHQEKVLEYQRKQIAGLVDNTKELETQLILKCAQLHLKPIEIIIPFAEELRLPDYIFKKLRTNTHYLTLIKAIAFWHQAQRTVYYKNDTTPYIRATLDDVACANKLSREVLLRKSDELNGAQRAFFESIKSYCVANKCKSFLSSLLRKEKKMHPQQMARYLGELRQRGYIMLVSKSQKVGYEYEVLMWDDYEHLKQGLQLLDDILKELRVKYKE